MKSYICSILLCAAMLSSVTGLRAQTTLISGNGPIGTRDSANLFSIDGGLTFTNAFIINSNPGYSNITGTAWISVSSNGEGASNSTNIYRTFFTLSAGFTDPSLTIKILADDQAAVFLNGTLIGTQPAPAGQNYVSPPSVFSTTNPALFLTGQNVIEIRNYNLAAFPSTNPTGIDYQAVVVPEPNGLVLTILGVTGLLFLYRHRK